MARIYPICSSSEGNSTFIGTRGHGILVDAGCSFRALKNSLALIDTEMSGIEAVFITHEHTDHIKALEQLIKHTDIPIFASRGTAEALRETGKIPSDAVIYDIRDGYQSASFEVSCFKTSHDSAESVGYKIRYGGEYYAVCTDTGYITEETEAALGGCLAVLLESNYDEDMLRRNPNYPPLLKARILGEQGHLSNVLCAEFAERLVRGGTRHLILGHLSRENNTPATAKGVTKKYLAERGLIEERDFTLNVAPVQTTGEYIAV
ncbi:MAG: MBL fold metallo-hydrolase [Oscillospiraceae bacterium]|nr:MBL fold metallo-hydrolase [Oscillospiraceae bacterium]